MNILVFHSELQLCTESQYNVQSVQHFRFPFFLCLSIPLSHFSAVYGQFVLVTIQLDKIITREDVILFLLVLFYSKKAIINFRYKRIISLFDV